MATILISRPTESLTITASGDPAVQRGEYEVNGVPLDVRQYIVRVGAYGAIHLTPLEARLLAQDLLTFLSGDDDPDRRRT